MIKSSRIVAPHVKTIESLRNCALNNERAIADIVDNSFDANADTVIITIGKNITTPIDLLVYACANEILPVGEATLSDGTKLTDVIECMVGDMSDNLRIEMEE